MADHSFAPPAHVRAAPTHPDPYPYYLALTERGLFWDEGQRVWVAASAEAVAAVFASPHLQTRPPDGRVPNAMANTPVASVFSRLVRMRDGAEHQRLKRALIAAMQTYSRSEIVELTRAIGAPLIAELEPQRDGAQLTQFLTALSSRTIAALLGVPQEHRAGVERWVGEYGAAASAAVTGSPPVTEALMRTGGDAARHMLDLFGQLIARGDDALSSRFARLARAAGVTDADDIAANAAGVLLQGQGAIAALMALALLAMAREPELTDKIARRPESLPLLLQEVMRCDTGTQSTLRFAADYCEVAGQLLRKNDCIIVLIAAANRDPALNSLPMRFDVERPDRQHFEFGRGAHACPGTEAAIAIAQTGIELLLPLGVARPALAQTVIYRPSAHIRIPAFTA